MIHSRGIWKKSSYSESGACLEFRAQERVHLRDSKFPLVRHVSCTADAWGRFIEYVKSSKSSL
ncbi:DUF397 domain-containing protein [Streptomyces sp. P9-2]|uniref:DUF397 domain-containing protein n=1 Tax=Streptomyces sp. P9-2 TaxID=3423201 RepID=UPI003F745303